MTKNKTEKVQILETVLLILWLGFIPKENCKSWYLHSEAIIMIITIIIVVVVV